MSANQAMNTRVIPLQTHEMFESLYNPSSKKSEPSLIYFTADWCGACKRIDWDFILEEFPNLPVYKCDVDVNKYTPGFCQVRSIPNFVIIKGPKQVVGPMQSNDTAKVASWIHSTIVNDKNPTK